MKNRMLMISVALGVVALVVLNQSRPLRVVTGKPPSASLRKRLDAGDIVKSVDELTKGEKWAELEALAHAEQKTSTARQQDLSGVLAATSIRQLDFNSGLKNLMFTLYGYRKNLIRVQGMELERAWLFRLASSAGDERLRNRSYDDLFNDDVKIPGTNEKMNVRKFSNRKEANVALYLAAHYWWLLDEDHALFYLKQAQALDPSAKVPSIETWRLPILESQGKPHPDGALPRIPFVRNPVDVFSKQRKTPLEVPELSTPTNR